MTSGFGGVVDLTARPGRAPSSACVHYQTNSILVP